MRLRFWLVLAAFAVAAPLAAEARPRDDAMSGAFRCAAIGDSRQWLDCYYGAAQPVRAGLGLAAAPAAQLRLAASPPPGSAQDVAVRDTVMGGAFGCNALADDRQWLDCYYAAAQPMRGQLGLTPAPQFRPVIASVAPPVYPVSSAPVFNAPAPSFVPSGLPPGTQPSAPAKPLVDPNAGWRPTREVSRVVAYSFDPRNFFTVTLANGEVWRQLASDRVLANWKKPPGAYRVDVTRDGSGNYNLQLTDAPGLYQVERLK